MSQFVNPDGSIENLRVPDIGSRLVSHKEVMSIISNRIRLKIVDHAVQDSASATILAQYGILAKVIEHLNNSENLTFVELAVGSGTISKIAEAVSNELGLTYGTSSERLDGSLERNGTLPSYSSPSQLASSRGPSSEDRIPLALRPVDY